MYNTGPCANNPCRVANCRGNDCVGNCTANTANAPFFTCTCPKGYGGNTCGDGTYLHVSSIITILI